jgi:hypothetical protein
MVRPFSHRFPALLAAGVAASAVAAAPALATEGPSAPPPGPSLPTGLTPPTFAPFTTPAAPIARHRSTRMIRRARLVHRRVRRGQRARLRVALAAPSKLRIVMSRSPGGRRIRAINVPARGRTVSLRLPARTRGHALRPGRYRISVVALDAQGVRSAPVKLTLTVRRRAHR